jgi:hypothetical protein
MDRRVWQPGAAQVRPPILTGEGGGIFPGRLPFMDPTADEPLLSIMYSHERRREFPGWLRSL